MTWPIVLTIASEKSPNVSPSVLNCFLDELFVKALSSTNLPQDFIYDIVDAAVTILVFSS